MTSYDRTPRPPFLLGLNYPWHGYGWDFGPTPYGEGLVRRERDAIARALDALAGRGIDVLRWFVAMDGRNVPSPGGTIRAIARVRRYEGLGSYLERTASDRDVLAALRPPADFIDDVAGLADMVAARGMKLLPTFISSTFLTPTRDEHLTDAYIAGGRAALVFGNAVLPKKRLFSGYVCGIDDTASGIARVRGDVHAFVEHALVPLVDALPRRAIFAWDVMNEPEWCIRGTPYTKGHAGALLHPWLVLTYLGAALRAVARRGLDVSIGFVDGDVSTWFPPTPTAPTFARWLDATLSDLPDVVYFHQHHHYPRVTDARPAPKTLPHVMDFGLGARPVLLGEYAMRFAAGLVRGGAAAVDEATRRKVAIWPDARGESDEASYLEQRLVLAKGRGYAGALGWAGPGDPKNGQSCYADGTDAVEKALAQIARVTRAT